MLEKEEEAQLLAQLIEIVDERDKLVLNTEQERIK